MLLARAGDGPLALACCRVIDFYADRIGAVQTLSQLDGGGVVSTVPEAHQEAGGEGSGRRAFFGFGSFPRGHVCRGRNGGHEVWRGLGDSGNRTEREHAGPIR